MLTKIEVFYRGMRPMRMTNRTSERRETDFIPEVKPSPVQVYKFLQIQLNTLQCHNYELFCFHKIALVVSFFVYQF